MKLRATVLALLLALGLTACASTVGQSTLTVSGTAYQIYFATDQSEFHQTAIESERHILADEVETIPALLNLVLAEPQTQGLLSAVPQGTALLSWSLDHSVLKVNLSEHYGSLSGMELTLADYTIVLTLCQLEAVEAVVITVEGQPIAFRNHQILYGSDVILSSQQDDPFYVSVNLYYPREDSATLSSELRDVMVTTSQTLPAAVVAALLQPPAQEQCTPLFDETVELLNVYVEQEICYVDLSAWPSNFATDISEWLTVYSLVETLTALEEVNEVQILVNGQLPPVGQLPDISVPIKSSGAWTQED